jgi:transcriptional regulator with XRE-family HTH domain
VALRTGIGRQLAELREEFELSQLAVATAAGIDSGHLSRIERGTAAASVDTLVTLAATLGADLGVRLFHTTGPRLRDHLQAPIVEALVRRLDPRWRASPEVPLPAAHGVVDVVLRLDSAGLSIACEVHSELRSIERIQRRLFEKAQALGDLDGRTSSAILLVRATERTRAVARQFEATLGAAFPGSCLAAIEALTGAHGSIVPPAWPGPTMLWARVEGRRAELLDEPPRGVRIGRTPVGGMQGSA